MKKVSILGATGSIGKSTLDLIERSPGEFDVVALTASVNVGALADAMARVLGDAELRASLIARGHERVKQFSWQRSVARVRDIYRELAEAPRG